MSVPVAELPWLELRAQRLAAAIRGVLASGLRGLGFR
jgi:hypothetical protein